MKISRWALRAAALLALSAGASSLAAQGTTTGAITGRIIDANGAGIEGAQIQVTNTSTGYVTGALSRSNGLYTVQGLEVGGPYRVVARRIGYEQVDTTGITVTLSQATRVDLRLQQQTVTLAGVMVTGTPEGSEFSPSRQGVATVVGDTIIRRVPTLQRDFTDLVKLTPQVVTNTGGGPSAAGGYNRLNNFTVDGVNQNDRFNLGSSGGVPGGATSGRIMSIEAVKEFQVLMSPSDVRHGNFAGMKVNAVTKNGTNQLLGGATYTFRTPGMAADVDQIRQSGFKVQNFGFSLGGPIIEDKLHFFIAPEFQRRTDPTSGPIVDVASNTIGTATTQISLDSIALIQNYIANRPDGFDPGHTGAFPRGNPLSNIMARLDYSINEQNRLTFRILDNTAEQDEFSRNTNTIASNATQQSTGIRLTSHMFTREARNRSIAAQLFTNTERGMFNEFTVGYNTIGDKRIVPINAPEISVGVRPNGSTSAVAVTFGTERFSPGNDLQQKILELSNNLTIPYGVHTFMVGGRYEFTDIYNYFLSGAGNGAYTFPTIAALQAGTPSAYAFSYANGGDIAAKFRGQQFSLYGQDLWSVTPDLSITAGLRLDVPSFLDTPKQNDSITARAAHIRTDHVPKTQLLWSPRLGFNWNVNGNQTTQVRGNVGIFTGNTPYILVGNAFSNTGLGGVTVGCTGAAVPAFTLDVSQLPTSCAGQPAPTPGLAGTVGVNVTDPNFKYPQNFTTSLGLDHRLPWDVIGTFEALYRKEINALYVRDLNLKGPRMVGGSIYTDRHGRYLYADTITVSGTGSLTVQNANQKHITSVGVPPVNFTEGAIELTNAKAGHNYALTGQLRKRFNRAFEATGAYTYKQAYDVQTLTSDRAISNWRFGRQFSGLEYDPNDAQVSNFQRPHRWLGYGTWTAPWRKNQTDVTFYAERISGIAVTYVVNNDINGDGIGGNDPIYVPNNAKDPNEFRIGTGTGGAFALADSVADRFERFIALQPCLNKQRGQIMKRNSCQGPDQTRIDVSVRQTLPEIRGQRLTAQLDVFNFANLVNKKWGQNRQLLGGTFNNQTVLTTASREAAPLGTGHWNYNLNAGVNNAIRDNDAYTSLNPNTPSNNYQMQLTFRYTF